jgi:hypothetical protein
MNARIPLCMAQALAPFAPPSSTVHQIVNEDRALQADLANLRLKQSGRVEQRRDEVAVRVQQERLGAIGELK